jgi:soluble lytic murein transglycosylase-like protein
MIEFVIIGVAATLFYLLSKISKPHVLKSQTGTIKATPDTPATPTKEIIPTSTSEQMKALIIQTCKQESYRRPELAIAIAMQESNLNPLAVNKEINTSKAGGDQPDSIGLMQVQFRTAKAFVPSITSEQELYHPPINILAGVRYLKYLEVNWLDKLGLDAVIQMYNLGEPRYLQGSRATTYLFQVKMKAGYA